MVKNDRVVLQPFERKPITRFARKSKDCEPAVTVPTGEATSRVSRLVTLKKPSTST